jgi:hypothetical protein
MDTQGQETNSGYTHDDVAIERPPSIGLDERRMHVRAYNYWASLLGNRLYPSLDDFDPAGLDDFGPHGVVLNFTDPTRPLLKFIGHALREECGLDERISKIADVPNRSLLSRLTDHFLEVIANRAPIGFEAEFVGSRGNNTMYRGILMPLSSDGETIDNLYGVINWKELADAETTAALAVEVDRALAQRPSFVAMNPVWADSPMRLVPEPISPELMELAALSPNAALEIRLAAARAASRQATASLSRALALTYDLALASEGDPIFPLLLAEEGIALPSSDLMTTIVRLVLGAHSDRTLVRGLATLLDQGRRADVAQGTFESYLEDHYGGLAAAIAEARTTRRR